MNKLISLDRVDRGSNKEKLLSFENNFQLTINNVFADILINYNVAKPRLSFFKNNNGLEFNLNYFFGFSDDKLKDFTETYKSYLTRMPEEMIPLGAIDGGDLLCLNNETGEVYYWFHEENDWGLEGNTKYPTKVGLSLGDFLEALVPLEKPTDQEIERAKKEGQRLSISPIGLELLNKDRAKRGLPPLSMEEAMANKRY